MRRVSSVILTVILGAFLGSAIAGLIEGCATVKQAEPVIVADLSACKPEEQALVNAAFPLIADYAICLALNSSNTSACQAQKQAMEAQAKASAIQCGLALIQKADQAAVSALNHDAGQD
jgi:hypothetical protein